MHRLGKARRRGLTKIILTCRWIQNFMNAPGDTALQQAVHHLQTGDPGAAEAICKRVLAGKPDQFAALNLLGVIAMQTGRTDNAISLFEKSAAAHPQFVDAFLNLGNARRQTGNLDGAEGAFRRCLELAPDDTAVKMSLGTVLHEQGRPSDAVPLLQDCLAAVPGHPQVCFVLGLALAERGDHEAAIEAFRGAIAANPDDADALTQLGQCLKACGRLDEASSAMRAVLAMKPDSAEAHNNLAVIMRHQGELDGARSALEQALLIDSSFVEAHNNMGHTLAELGDLDGAIAAFQQALAIAPNDADTLTNLAGLGERSNRLDIAEPAITKGLALAPADPDLNLLAAQCERRKGEIAGAIQRLEAIDHAEVRPQTAIDIGFELGRLYDRAGETETAFEVFAAANTLAAAYPPYRRADKNAFLKLIDTVGEQLTPAWVESWTPPSPRIASALAPTFLVAFPRSGTTLVQQALASHPDLVALDERPTVDAMLAHAPGFPGAIAGYDNAILDGLRAHYDETARACADFSDLGHLVDKMPLNIPYLPLIARVFPKARYLLVLRHPHDACLSGYMQNFVINDAMASFFSLEDAAALYAKTMSLWQKASETLRLNHHVVRYEDLIDDFDGEMGRILDFIGVGWDPAVRDYATNAQKSGRILTPSYQQVTEPIYQRARYRWERYSQQLAPIREPLRPFVDAFGYADRQPGQ